MHDAVQVGTVALEEFVRAHIDLHVEIPRRRAALAGLATPAAADVHAALAAYQDEMVPRGVAVVTGARAQLGFYQDGWQKVRILGHPLRELPREKVEVGPEGVRITPVE